MTRVSFFKLHNNDQKSRKDKDHNNNFIVWCNYTHAVLCTFCGCHNARRRRVASRGSGKSTLDNSEQGLVNLDNGQRGDSLD